MLLFRADPFGGTHELLPCGLLRGDLVELFRNNKSKYYWYDLTVRGERYRGSTKETNETRAQKAAALKRPNRLCRRWRGIAISQAHARSRRSLWQDREFAIHLR